MSISPFKFSVLHASYGRPRKALAAMEDVLHKADQPQLVNYVFALNGDDPDLPLYLPAIRGREMPHIVAAFNGSASAWDAAARASAGEILIQGQDDVEFPDHWDTLLTERICAELQSVRAAVDPRLQPFFVAVSDGFRKDELCCTAIMSRAYMDLEGHFLYSGYISVFSDDEVTYRALRNDRDRRAKFLRMRDVVFLHRHAYHDKSVPVDYTYERENSAHAYAHGLRLFRDRNPRALTDGLKTW